MKPKQENDIEPPDVNRQYRSWIKLLSRAMAQDLGLAFCERRSKSAAGGGLELRHPAYV